MSFYGQVLYEFTKLFHKIWIRNDGAKTYTTPERTPEDAYFMPDDKWDSLSFNSGNHWIHLESSNKEKGNMITISHNTPGEKKYELIGFNGNPNFGDSDIDPIVLTPGKVFTVNSGEFDNAGHLIKQPSTKIYKLPTQAITLDSNDDVIASSPKDNNLHFQSSDNWIDLSKVSNNGVDALDITHNVQWTDTKPKSVHGFKYEESVTPELGYTALEPGKTFITNGVKVDNAGHITEITTQGYILPQSETEKNIEDLQDAVEKLQETTTEHQKALDNFPNDYITQDKLTNVEDNLLDIVGNIEDYSKKIAATNNETYTNQKYSISESRQILSDTLGGNNTITNATNSAVKQILIVLKTLHPNEFNHITL